MSFDVNGDEPDIIGKQCEGVYLLQHQEDGVISDQANVAYFKFESEWLKFYFDGENCFWRICEMPSEPVNSCLSTCLVLLNLNEFDGVVGCSLNNIQYNRNDKFVFVSFDFTGGKTLKFKHDSYNDFTSVAS